MATLLVDIQVHTLEELNNKIEQLNEQVNWQLMLDQLFSQSDVPKNVTSREIVNKQKEVGISFLIG